MNHGFDADLIVFFHVIAEAGDLRPVGEFASRAENVFFLIGAEKIGSVFIPESDVMENGARDGVARGINQFWVIREKPAGDRDRPDEVWWLGHFHVGSVGGEIHRADAQRDGVGICVGDGV